MVKAWVGFEEVSARVKVWFQRQSSLLVTVRPWVDRLQSMSYEIIARQWTCLYRLECVSAASVAFSDFRSLVGDDVVIGYFLVHCNADGSDVCCGRDRRSSREVCCSVGAWTIRGSLSSDEYYWDR